VRQVAYHVHSEKLIHSDNNKHQQAGNLGKDQNYLHSREPVHDAMQMAWIEHTLSTGFKDIAGTSACSANM